MIYSKIAVGMSDLESFEIKRDVKIKFCLKEFKPGLRGAAGELEHP